MTVPEENKIIARRAAEVFGTKPSVAEYWDDNNQSSVDILVCEDSPQKGVNSYSTVSLSSHEIGTVDKRPLGVEMVAACDKKFAKMANIVATSSFNIINSGHTCKPGVVFPKVVDMYYPQLTMKHVLFTSPFLWDRKLKTLDLNRGKVAWLMMVPISESEFNFLEVKGFEELDKLFEAKQINVFDLNRESVV